MQLILSLIIGIVLLLVIPGFGYIYLLTLATLLPGPRFKLAGSAQTHFAVAIPAHNEAEVIQRTISTLQVCEYPADCIDIFVVADHCSDETALTARECGAVVFERNQGERGKGPALAWLFQKIFESGKEYQVVAIFDADTVVAPEFFEVMNVRFAAGAKAVQGRHVIRNPQAGWFPALTWAMFIIDNRFENLGRSNLDFSAKNMGDSICFRVDILKKFGWGIGLTEDFAFRQRLLLEGIRIGFEPRAVGYGDAALNWKEAAPQRQRWLRGAYQASRKNARAMLAKGLAHLDLALLDGAVYAYLPSYSTLTLLASLFVVLSFLLRQQIWSWLPGAWLAVFILLFAFPLINLALDRAPLKAFLVILNGPLFIFWRSALSVYARFLRRQVDWVRTPRHL
jgi:cellulose synthase/poly-beta-1,6-N-acetylglucosamine synthase-like glycosyltransferase